MRPPGHTLFVLFGLIGQSLVGCGPPSGGSSSQATSRPRVALVVYDAGETLALLPVVDRLASTEIQVEWVPLTPWAASLLAANGRSFLPLPEGIEEMPHVLSREGGQEPSVWIDAFTRSKPDLAILGMVSEAQRRIGAHLRELGVPTRGIYDGFQPPDETSIGLRAAQFVDEVWVSTARVRDGFAALGMETVVSGQPTLESWRRVAEETDAQTVRRTQGVRSHQRVLLFAGQYGPGYEEVLGSFLEAMRDLLVADSSLFLILSHHPRTDGQVERRALSRTFSEPTLAGRAAMMAEGLTTAQMATAAEVVLTWTSTVGVQAAFMGKQVIYYSPPETFDSYLIDEGAAMLAEEESLEPLLRSALAHPPSPGEIRERLVSAGYVVDADEVVADLILAALSR